MKILSISLARNILKQGSRDRDRMRKYVAELTEYHIVVLTRKEHGYTEVIHEGNLHIYPTNSRFRFLMLWDAFWIGRMICAETTKESFVVSAQDPLFIGWVSWCIAWKANVRFHVQVHGDYFSSDAWTKGSIVRKIQRFFALILLKISPSIRVVSERIRNSLIARGIRPERITVLPIRPELETFLAQTHICREIPPYRFLYIGRLAPEKDISRIVLAFLEVYAKNPHVRLRIVGEGSEKDTIQNLVHKHHLADVVSFAPWTESVAEEMSEADVFLLASRHEAYALTLIEALAVGIPVVTTDVGCVGEVVQDRVHGLVVRGMGVKPYAGAMKEMIENTELRRVCGGEGRKTAKSIAKTTMEEYVHAWVTSISKAR